MIYSEITFKWLFLAWQQACVYINLPVLKPNVETWAEASRYICKSHTLVNSIFEETHTPTPCVVQNANSCDFVFALAAIAKDSA